MSKRIRVMEKRIENIEYNVREILTTLSTMKVKLDILCNNYQSDVHDRLKDKQWRNRELLKFMEESK